MKVETSGLYPPVRPDWLAGHVEEPLLPDFAVVDAHHHLWDRQEGRYLLDEFAADVSSGHRIDATVYVDCRSMYRSDGPPEYRPLGEVEFANGIAAMSASGTYGQTRICAAIVGSVELRLGDAVRPVLEAMRERAGRRFRGIRQVSAWDGDARVTRPIASRPAGLLLDSEFRAGFAALGRAGLSFDAFLFHPQLGELADLASAFPETQIVLDHCGGPVGIGHYGERRDEEFDAWRASIRDVALRDNVCVKLSGLGMRMPGFDFHERSAPPGSSELALAWAPYLETCIEAFGADRCMFASNFPPDKGTCSYAVLWNAFKKFAGAASDGERRALFNGTARRVYRIEHDTPQFRK